MNLNHIYGVKHWDKGSVVSLRAFWRIKKFLYLNKDETLIYGKSASKYNSLLKEASQKLLKKMEMTETCHQALLTGTWPTTNIRLCKNYPKVTRRSEVRSTQ